MQPRPGVYIQYYNGTKLMLGPDYVQDWETLSSRADAEAGLRLLLPFCPDANLVDDGSTLVTVFSEDPTIKMWAIKGTYTDPRFKEPLVVDEWAGAILDRYSHPHIGIDKIDLGMQPGIIPAKPRYLKPQVDSYGDVEFIWTNYL